MPVSEFDNPAFLDRLRRGDARAYNQLVRRYHGILVGVAGSVIGSRAQAEEVVQDTWLAVLGSIANFEGRSSLSTWLFSIVMNRARTRVAREGRLVGLPDGLDGSSGEERAVPLSAFVADGHWDVAPRLWDELDPERVVSGRQLWEHVLAGLETLPAGQKAVLVLRDMEGQSAEEACTLLNISPENQRVLLHRARGRIRALIDTLTAAPGVQVPVRVPAAAIAPDRRTGTVQRLATAVQVLWRGLRDRLHQASAALLAPWRSRCSKAAASVR